MKRKNKNRIKIYFFLALVCAVLIKIYTSSTLQVLASDLDNLNYGMDGLIEQGNGYLKEIEYQKRESKFSDVGLRTVTMYTSRPEETDASPCIGAGGQDQCAMWKSGQNICASNEFKIGTLLRIEGLGECIVLDRMNKRYTNNIDWYNGYDEECLDGYDKYDICPQLREALKFGAKQKQVNVFNLDL